MVIQLNLPPIEKGVTPFAFRVSAAFSSSWNVVGSLMLYFAEKCLLVDEAKRADLVGDTVKISAVAGVMSEATRASHFG